MTQTFARFLLKMMGWQATAPKVPEKRCIRVGVPHTSIYDFVVGYIYYRSVGGRMKTMIKKEAFFWPLGPILKAMGGIPVDRGHAEGLVRSLIHEMENEEGDLHLVICPEGTRRATKRWKTGYHTIAREAGIPVYMGHFDYEKKEVGRGELFELTDDARGDTNRLQALYEAHGYAAMYPERYTTK
ncbi:MAG: 1-acyl-sn-glycerol-3-phosphate acyltransferase [Bacteroidales bacterium]|nr:1-acyl-sn-glycerol-3-phosphate acyltransferase [Bacteroidales bacterium]